MKKAIRYIAIMIFISPICLMGNDCNYVMEDEQLKTIMNHMKNNTDDVKNLNIIKTYLQRLCIDTEQMLSIMQVFESESTRNQFFLYSKEYIIDIENYNKLKIN